MGVKYSQKHAHVQDNLIATALLPRPYRHQTSDLHVLLFHPSLWLPINIRGYAPFVMGLCPLHCQNS